MTGPAAVWRRVGRRGLASLAVALLALLVAAPALAAAEGEPDVPAEPGLTAAATCLPAGTPAVGITVTDPRPGLSAALEGDGGRSGHELVLPDDHEGSLSDEVALVDDAGQPLPAGAYELTLRDGDEPLGEPLALVIGVPLGDPSLTVQGEAPHVTVGWTVPEADGVRGWLARSVAGAAFERVLPAQPAGAGTWADDLPLREGAYEVVYRLTVTATGACRTSVLAVVEVPSAPGDDGGDDAGDDGDGGSDDGNGGGDDGNGGGDDDGSGDEDGNDRSGDDGGNRPGDGSGEGTDDGGRSDNRRPDRGDAPKTPERPSDDGGRQPTGGDRDRRDEPPGAAGGGRTGGTPRGGSSDGGTSGGWRIAGPRELALAGGPARRLASVTPVLPPATAGPASTGGGSLASVPNPQFAPPAQVAAPQVAPAGPVSQVRVAPTPVSQVAVTPSASLAVTSAGDLPAAAVSVAAGMLLLSLLTNRQTLRRR